MQNPTPQAVIDFAEEHGFKNGIHYIGKWNNYTVYMPDYSDMKVGTVWGLPSFILTKGEMIRWADVDEGDSLMSLVRKR